MSIDLGAVLLEQIKTTDAMMRDSFAGVREALETLPIETLRGWKLVNKETLAMCSCAKDKAKLTEIENVLDLMIAYKSWRALLPLLEDTLQNGCDPAEISYTP